ncbi:MAG TPA: regulatory protein RecX [Candidatus Acidoferrales bacterium]|nr:regulatory protein RecX [Candidatus Acidoferrales bacterium]
MKQPRQLDTENELYLAAIGALSRRAHSVAEMRRFLERRASAPELTPPVLARLKAEGLLDDARYARQFARARVANRRQGRFRIARELRARGVPGRHIEAALGEISTQTDEAALLRGRAERWLKLHRIADPAALEPKRLASLYRSLLRAGFPSDRIRAELHRLGHPGDSLPETLPDH